MSGVQVAVLPGGASPPALSRSDGGASAERRGIEGTAFAALGLYGVARWDTLFSGGLGRLVGMLALGSAIAVAGPVLARRSRWLAGLALAGGAVVGLALAGVPLDWIVHLRVAVTATAIGNGLSALPEITVPYTGIDQWVNLTLLLGAMVLLLDAALVLTFVPRRLGLLRRAGAALPLLALSVIPATVLRPRSAYLEGVFLFALVVLFLWGDRIHSQRLSGVAGPCALAAALALGLAPALDSHHAWINYRKLATNLAAGSVDTFDWVQGYGPLNWPHSGRAVLEVQAAHPEYWKAENLDVFDGTGWVAGRAPVSVPWQTGVSPSSLERWTQTLQVTVDGMSTSRIIVAGSAYPPAVLSGTALDGGSPGTWLSSRRLEPGASYRVRTYAPNPSPAQLAAAGTAYPAALAQAYLTLDVPEIPGLLGAAAASYAGQGSLEQVVLPAFGGQPSVMSPSSVATALTSSPYAQVFALAQRLKAGARTPYDYVHRVERYLAHGYRYSQTPPVSRYPLESFLVNHKLGYCQHFAGAMALLLRMGGVPARVAVGFTTGTFDSATRRWVVSDLGAHAWVEAWFSRYGWVRFDPTPAADPALSDNSAPAGAGSAARTPPVPRFHHRELGGASTSQPKIQDHRASRGSDTWVAVLGPVALIALLLLLLLTRARPGADPVSELIRAYARTGRPLDTATTLARLESRLAHSPDAARYVRALRLVRFGGAQAEGYAPGAPARSLKGRRALRRSLSTGLGPLGRARAWWALPPRWRWPNKR